MKCRSRLSRQTARAVVCSRSRSLLAYLIARRLLARLFISRRLLARWFASHRLLGHSVAFLFARWFASPRVLGLLVCSVILLLSSLID